MCRPPHKKQQQCLSSDLPRALVVETLTSYLDHQELLCARLISKAVFEAIAPYIFIMRPGDPFCPPPTVRDMWLVGSLDMPAFAAWFDPNKYAFLENIIVNVDSTLPNDWRPYEELFRRAFEEPVWPGKITLMHVKGPWAFMSALLNHPRVQNLVDPQTRYRRLGGEFWYEESFLNRIDPIWGSPYALEMLREDLRCLWQSVHGNKDIEAATKIFTSGSAFYYDHMEALIDTHRRINLVKQLKDLGCEVEAEEGDVRDIYRQVMRCLFAAEEGELVEEEDFDW